MEINNIHLKTAHLNDLKEFYADTVDCSITNTGTDEFTVTIGTTDVVFAEADDGSDPFYHFAINVPQNQFEDAVAWLADRVELLSDVETGDSEVFFEDWNAHAAYCLDPAGNLLELIARHDLSNDSARPFDSENFLEVSEIGLPVSNVKRTVETLRDNIGVSLRNNRGAAITDDTSFAAVGDDHGLFIVVEEGREWFATRNQTAEVHPVTVGISDAATEYVFPDFPYRISSS